MKLRIIAGLLALAFASPAFAQVTVPVGDTTPARTANSTVCINPTTKLQESCGGGDANGVAFDAPFVGAVAFVLDTPQTARRSIGANCTVSGNVALTFGDATTLTVPVSVGWQTFPFAITTVNSSGTTATCTYSNLK